MYPKRVNVIQLYQKYASEVGMNVKAPDFGGVDFSDLMTLERIFDRRIVVMQLKSNGETVVVWSSARSAGEDLYLDIQQNHFSYIKDIESYASVFVCPTCDRCYGRYQYVKSHACKPDEASRLAFDGGEFKPPDTIFDKLSEKAGIDIAKDDDLRFYPYRITYDIECYLPKDKLPASTDTIVYNNRHELLSISVCSNVPDYEEAQCFVTEGNAKECVSRFVDYIYEISQSAGELMKESFADVLHRLDELNDRSDRIEQPFAKKHWSSSATSYRDFH